MVPTELLVTAMIGAFAIALTALVAMVRVLGARIDEQGVHLGTRIEEQGSQLGARIDEQGVHLGTRIEEQGVHLGARIDGVRADVQELRRDVGGRFDGLELRFAAIDTRMGSVQDDLTTARASLGAIDARLTTLEQR